MAPRKEGEPQPSKLWWIAVAALCVLLFLAWRSPERFAEIPFFLLIF